MKTLPDILHDALLLLQQADNEHDEGVVIARGQQLAAFEGQPLRLITSEAFQIRLWREINDSAGTDLYRCQARSWIGTKWSPWSEHRSWLAGASFDIQDVLATDWRIIAS